MGEVSSLEKAIRLLVVDLKGFGLPCLEFVGSFGLLACLEITGSGLLP